MALQRLQNTEKRLLRNTDEGKAYCDVIEQYIEKGYVRKVERDENFPNNKWYLPHFPVIRHDKDTTKTRIVFDASVVHKGVSLNDCIHQGPKLQNELFDVLLRFRRNEIALVCDIAEMYLQIKLKPIDRPYHRFLWRSLDTSKPPDEYEFNSLVFGVNCSPFLAQYIARKNAEDNIETYPLASKTVLKSTYMDDSMDSVTDIEEAVKLYHELSTLWGKAHMHARKWLSNSPEVLEHIPVKDRASHVNLNSDNLPTIKTLGILWIADRDVFTFKTAIKAEHTQMTKRKFLKRIATLFDPLGFLMPFTIRAKILLQEMWVSGSDWDDPIDDKLSNITATWFQEMQNIDMVSIPRCLKLTKSMTSERLHVFVDASQEAYGSVVYLQCSYEDQTSSVRFVTSKSRVAPLKAVSIPRLELMAAVLGSRLASSVCSALEIVISEVTFWSDSMNVLWWIRGRSRCFKPFVANRVSYIQDMSNPKQWRYVPTKQNPADMLTRGTKILALVSSKLWWEGPSFLALSETDWPVTKIESDEIANEEVKRHLRDQIKKADQTDSQTMVVIENEEQWRLEPNRHSSWSKLTKIQAWVYRFIGNCRTTKDKRQSGELSPEEIKDTEISIIKKAQMKAFDINYQHLRKGKIEPKNSKLIELQPFLDVDGVIRSNSRLKYAEFLPYDTKFPIVLPRKHWVTKLIVRHYHEIEKHASGTNQTLAALSSQYWIISAREEIREMEKECIKCQLKKASPATQVMAPLHESRLKLTLRAFDHSAVDFGGPFITTQGRGKRREKRYLCLFTCLTTRAVHLEIAYGLDTDSFLNAFYRMASRRGLPQEMTSDNGTNFVSANRELKELVAQLDTKIVQKSTANKGVKWHFNPPAAPHFGGAHETMIKAAKRATYAILGNADITDEELMTAFIGAEGLINSRPLTYQSANPKDDVPLTPNHFLHGQIGGQFAPEAVDQVQYNPRKRWRRIQELVRHFWHRWLQEWLPGLSARKKWNQTNEDIKQGDVVLAIMPDTPRGHWPLGRIIETTRGRDGHVRVVKVQVGKNVYSRPISKICPLEFGKQE